MILETLTRLVKSLSGSEKRYFKLNTRQQAGQKDYLQLFHLIEQYPEPEFDSTLIRKRFKKKCPKSSLNDTSRYLLKLLTDSLIKSKMEKDTFFQLLQDIMRAKILQERSLGDESYALLKKVRKTAASQQHYLFEYLILREELSYSADTNYQKWNDHILVESQMKAKDILRTLNHIQDHHSLFELLKYRLVYSGKLSSDEEKKQLNDLMLSEMVLVSGKSKNSFAAQKLHLLFQSYFFTDIGDYQSALRAFYALNQLFENNMRLLDNPPLDYLSALNGILDILHAFRETKQMSFYIHKAQQLNKPIYPEYFRFQVLKTVFVYELAKLLGENQFDEAITLVTSTDPDILTSYHMINEEKQWELYFYCSLSYFKKGDLKRSHKYIDTVMQQHKMQPQLPVCKATRLLNMLIYYNQGEVDFLEYEIRSYRRFFKKNHPLLKSEKLFLKFISAWPDSKRKRLPSLQQRALTNEINLFAPDKYETQLLKYFDVLAWMKERINY